MKQRKATKRVLTAMLTLLAVVMTMSAFTAGDTKTFTKTKNKCTKCSCSGYHGYKHQNGTYEGNSSNTVQYGHKCGHGPEKHGLRKW